MAERSRELPARHTRRLRADPQVERQSETLVAVERFLLED
jgi:hypothetical protein